MNTFGTFFQVSLFGESHGPAVGAVIDGVLPGLPLCEADFEADIARRRSGAKGSTPRREKDLPRILSGVFDGRATGAPLTLVFDNDDTCSTDYAPLQDIPRPGHADYTASVKAEGFNDPRGGGHFSGRLTLPVVAAGVVAKKMLAALLEDSSIAINARLVELGGSPDESAWDALLEQAVAEGDSLGGVVDCVVDGLPAGLGEPFWDSVESRIAHAVFAIPGVRGIEFGDGFAAARMKGSAHNDPFGPDGEGVVRPLKNGAGGVNGGISNGAPLHFRTAFKPSSSIRKAQQTWNFATQGPVSLSVGGRHDACFALRTPVIVEAMTAIVLADLMSLA